MYDKDEVKRLITLDMMYELTEYLGARPRRVGSHLECLSMCHHSESRKLYVYAGAMCMCYSHCGSFDVFDLVRKVQNVSFVDAVTWVVSFFGLDGRLSDGPSAARDDWDAFGEYERAQEAAERAADGSSDVILPEYDDSFLGNMPPCRVDSWLRQGIKPEVLDLMNCRFDPVQWCAVIPFYDRLGRCVGIRRRTLVKDEERFGKYRPYRRGGTLYKHPLGLGFYAPPQTYDAIRDGGIAIVTEGEKSVLTSLSWFGEEGSFTVACCGHNLSERQFHTLLRSGASEICFAFDMDFRRRGDDDYVRCKRTLYDEARKCAPYVRTSIMFDERGRLGYKEGAFDHGRELFEDLFRGRWFI